MKPAAVLLLLPLIVAPWAAWAVNIETPGVACSNPEKPFFWEQSSICPSGTLVWQRPAFQFGASTSQTCNSGLAGMVQWTGTAASPNNTLQVCNGAGWTSFAASASSGILLGTTATANNPQATGDVNTGLFSATATTVSIATAGVERLRVTASGDVDITTSGRSLTLSGTGGLWQDVTNGNLSAGPTNMRNTVSQAGGGSNGLNNIALGAGALNAVTTGYENTAIGVGALQNTATGYRNTAVGYGAAPNVSLFTVAIGALALATSTYRDNTAVGASAMQYSGDGEGNSALGYQALAGTATGTNTGAYNTAAGSEAGKMVTSGSRNVILGYQVGSTTISTGSYNILIGTSSLVDTTASNSSNQLNIGNALYGTSVGTAGAAMLGLSSTPRTSFDLGTRTDALVLQSGTMGQRPGASVNGMVRYNTTTNAFEFYENSVWNTYTISSDRRLKRDIEPVAGALGMVDDLRPVHYYWDKKNPRADGMDEDRHTGFVAQELEGVIPDAVRVGGDGYRNVNVMPIVAVAVAAIKDMQAEIKDIEASNARLEKSNGRLESALEKLDSEEFKQRDDANLWNMWNTFPADTSRSSPFQNNGRGVEKPTRTLDTDGGGR